MSDVIEKTSERADTRIGRSVPEAGALIGLSRNAAYVAAKRGEIPTIKIGKKIIVPWAVFLKKFGVE